MSRTDATAKKYYGKIADTYDTQRVGKKKWEAEQLILRRYLTNLPPSIAVLDVPVGTGRLIPFYLSMGFTSVLGLDISPDMLAKARAKLPAGADKQIVLRKGSILATSLPDASVDVSLAIRIVNLLEPSDMQKALVELQRVTRNEIVFNIRVGDVGKFKHPHKEELVLDCLQPDWLLYNDAEIHEPDFRMFTLRNKNFSGYNEND